MASPPSPFTHAYTRLSEVFPGLAVREPVPGTPLPEGGGWIPAERLAQGGSALDVLLAEEDTRLVRDHGRTARPDVVAGFALHRYAWAAVLLITVPWFLCRRVPRLPVTNVSWRRADGHFAVRPAGFACLPGDPVATLPGALVVADEKALRAEVRAAAVEHLGPLLAAFGPRMRRRDHALWAMATDEIVEGLWYVGHLLGEERRAMSELGLLLPGATAPYTGSAAFRQLSGPQGEKLTTRDRAGCCLLYTLRPADTCVTCPRTGDTERIARLTGATTTA